jgi:hypothetical protein
MIPVTTVPLGTVEELPDHAKRLLPYMKVCIIVLYIVCILYFLIVPIDPMTAMINSFPALLGTFLLHEDRHLRPAYECLKNTALGAYCCRSPGLTNLAPFFLISSVNSIVIVFEMIPAFQKFGWTAFAYPMFPVLIAIAAVQLTLAVLGWQLLKACLPPGGGMLDGYQQLGDGLGAQDQAPMGMLGGNRGPFGSSGLGSAAPAPGGPSSSGASRGAARGASFQPFQGQGHKLGG